MRPVRGAIVALGFVIVAAACGGGDAPEASCEELVDEGVAVGQMLLDVAGDVTDGSELVALLASLQEGEPLPAVADYAAANDDLNRRIREQCEGPEYQEMLCSRADEFETASVSAANLLEDFYRSCEAQGHPVPAPTTTTTTTTTLDDGRDG